MCFPGGTAVENLPAIQEVQVQSLGLEDSLEKEMATHFSILAMDRGDSPWSHKESDTTDRLSMQTFGSGDRLEDPQ